MMKVEQCRYGRWSAAYRCSVGACEMIVVADVGPRILSLRQEDGPNLLHDDTTGFGVGDWRLYGGHRFTVAPEGGQSYIPDNAPCRVAACSQELCFEAPVGANGLRRTLIVGPSGDAEGFEIEHRLENHGGAPWHGAVWAITCVRSEGRVYGACVDGRVHFWPNARRTHWRIVSGRVAITPNGMRSKGGWYSDPAWVAAAQSHATLMIHAASAPSPASHVDGGCNVEVFTCADYVEIETLGAEVTLEPGEHALHRQYWRVLAPPFDWGEAAQIIARLHPSPSPSHAA